MTLDDAKAIVKDAAPHLLVDNSRPELTYLLAVHREGETQRSCFDVRQYNEADLRAAVGAL